MKTLLAIIGAFGILYSVLYFASNDHAHQCYSAEEIALKSDMKIIGLVINLYKEDHGRYPESLGKLVGEYLSEIPKDPWGEEYGYQHKEGGVVIYTYSQPKSKENISIRIEYSI